VTSHNRAKWATLYGCPLLPRFAVCCSQDISATAPQSGTIMTVTSETGRLWKQLLGEVIRAPFGAGDTRTCTATTTVTLLWSVARATATCLVRGTCCPCLWPSKHLSKQILILFWSFDTPPTSLRSIQRVLGYTATHSTGSVKKGNKRQQPPLKG
jgi:hypothetical protein